MLGDMILFNLFQMLSKCAPRPRWEAHFRRTIFANIVCKKIFPYPNCPKNHHFSRGISALCCAKSSMFCRLSGKWPTLEALTSAFASILKQIFISSVLILPLFLGSFVDRRFYLRLHSGFQYPRPRGMHGAIESAALAVWQALACQIQSTSPYPQNQILQIPLKSPPTGPAHSARPTQKVRRAGFGDFHFARHSPSEMQKS